MNIEDVRLYGLPGAEELHDDPATVWEDIEADLWPDSPTEWTIEEHAVHPPRYHLQSVAYVLESMMEWTADNGLLDEWAFERWDSASKEPDVVAAFEAAFDLLASKVTYYMADKVIATHTLTVVDGEPHLDGEPLYRKAAP